MDAVRGDEQEGKKGRLLSCYHAIPPAFDKLVGPRPFFRVPPMLAPHRLPNSIHWLLLFVCTLSTAGRYALAEDGKERRVLRAGIVGCDAHALPWTRILNNPQATGKLAEMKVVAAVPGGSPDIPQSMELLKKQRQAIEALGVEMVDSIEELLPKVDVVMLLSIDGRKHLPEARQVFPSGKPVFIDKPIGGTLAEAIAIFRLAKKHQVPVFTSSSLRFAKGTIDAAKNPKLGRIVGCDQYAPCPLEPHHPDFFWYGIHGVEPLFTIMGTGCVSVTRIHTDGNDVAVGVWKDGRIGVFRGIREGRRGYGSTIFGTRGIVPGGGFDGYEPLIEEIIRFFQTGKPPVTEAETLEIFAFMEAADESKRQGGKPVTLESVLKKAQQEAQRLVP